MKHVISLGAGVQSSTMALMAARGLIEPMPIAAVFADTHAEPPSVYRWLDWLEKQLPFPVRRVSKANIVESITTPKRKRDGSGWWVHSNIPAFVRNPDGSDGMVQRQCTTTFKIEPLRKEVRRLCEVKRGEKAPIVTQWIGISLDEAHRMKLSLYAWQVNRWPLVELKMRRGDCLEWMKRNGYPEPPRSACLFCPFHSNAEWKRLKREEPEAFAQAVTVEKLYQAAKAKGGHPHGQLFLHRSRVPLDQVNFEDERQGWLWGQECDGGACGL